MATIQNITIDQDADYTETLTIKDSLSMDKVNLTGYLLEAKVQLSLF